MNITRKRVLIYGLLTLLFTMACEFGNSPKIIIGNVTCQIKPESQWEVIFGDPEYDCQCKSGGEIRTYDASDLKIMNTDYFNKNLCGNSAASTDPALTEEAATEPPTEDPAATEPPVESAPITPLLKGSVSACDTAQGFINFPLAESNPNIAGKTLGVTLNGRAVTCGIPGVNTSVLSCPLPPGTVFPVTVSVTLAGVEVNNFSNDGYFCTNTSSSTGGGNTTQEEPVAPLTCIPDPDNPYACLP